MLNVYLYANKREKRTWILMGVEEGRIWEELGEGNHNQNILHEKILYFHLHP